jgi:glycosyltransferase involved in cell wall biosynthesis
VSGTVADTAAGTSRGGTRPATRQAAAQTLRVLQLPGSAGPASYVGLLSRALGATATEVVDGHDGLFRLGWTRHVDVVHLHWLEFIAASDGRPWRGLVRTVLRQLRLVTGLAWLRLRGVRVVWTVHNLASHEPIRPRLEWLLGFLVSRLADRLIVHSDYARRRVGRRWRTTRKVNVIPHGNYIDVFPSAGRSRTEVRSMQGIADEAYVFVAFGQVRPYKRLPQLVSAFSALPSPDVRLLIAGKPVVAEEADKLRAAAAQDPRVVLDLREIPDAEVADLLACADAAVLGYRDVFSSGALLLALSYGLPVVASGPGTATEIVRGSAGESFEAGGLTRALQAMQEGDRSQRSAAALDRAREYPWSRVGAETASLYRALVPRDAASTS